MADRELPDDAVVGLADEDYRFIQGYIQGEVSEEQFRERYERDGRIQIPVQLIDPGTPT